MNLACLDTCRQTLISLTARHDQLVFSRTRKWRTLSVLMVLCKQALFGRNHSIGTTLAMMGFGGVAASRAALGVARKKIGAEIFREAVQSIHRASSKHGVKKWNWRGHRVFAIDGTKVNVARVLLRSKYPKVNQSTHYPQALVTALFQLRAKTFVDFVVSRHNCETKNVRHHLQHLRAGDVVLYDRLYCCLRVLAVHARHQIDGVFRIKTKGTLQEIIQFAASRQREAVVLISRPGALMRLRLIRATIRNKPYYFATTLLDQVKYPTTSIINLYRERWQIEVAFKHCKRSLGLEFLRAKTTCTLKQEIGAVFLSYQLARIAEFKPSRRRPTSPKHIFALLAGALDATGLWDIAQTLRTYPLLIPDRPGRVFLRISRKPINRWQRSTDKEWRFQKRQLQRAKAT